MNADELRRALIRQDDADFLFASAVFRLVSRFRVTVDLSGCQQNPKIDAERQRQDDALIAAIERLKRGS